MMKKFRDGMVVVSNIDGTRYGIKKGSNGMVALEMTENDEISETAVPIALTDQMIPCFQLINDPNPFDIPEGFSVMNGVLTGPNGPVEQGSLKILSIVKEMPGYLIITVEPRDNELGKKGYIDLFTYSVELDTFNKLIRTSIPYRGDKKSIRLSDEALLMIYSETHDESITTDNGETVSVTRFDGAALMVYYHNKIRSYIAELPISTDDYKLVPVKDGWKLFVRYSEKMDRADKIDGRFVVPAKEILYEVYDITNDGYIEYCSSIDNIGLLQSVTINPFAEYYFAVGENGIVFDNKFCFRKENLSDWLLKECGKIHPYLVSYQKNDHVYTLCLADQTDSGISMVTLNITETKDRGLVFSIE